jgi:plastocyanin
VKFRVKTCPTALWLAVLLVPLASVAHGADGVAAAAPGSFVTTFATPIVVVEQGGGLTFANFDLPMHNLRQDLRANPLSEADATPDSAPTIAKEPWCFDAQGNPIDPLPGVAGCPRFWSANAATAGQTSVDGIGNLEAGKIYPFYCTIHPNMKGYLIVAPAE